MTDGNVNEGTGVRSGSTPPDEYCWTCEGKGWRYMPESPHTLHPFVKTTCSMCKGKGRRPAIDERC